MVHILGTLLQENHLVKFALTKFYGIGPHIAERICARFQIHDRAKIRDLRPQQITSLTAFLSSPSTAPIMPEYPVAPPDYETPRTVPSMPIPLKRGSVKSKDPLMDLKIETELRREIRENIAHHKNIGTYVGMRHALGLPVRGQNTQTNANNARKFNKLERRN